VSCERERAVQWEKFPSLCCALAICFFLCDLNLCVSHNSRRFAVPPFRRLSWRTKVHEFFRMATSEKKALHIWNKVQSHPTVPFTYFHEIIRYIQGKSLQLSANYTTPHTISSHITFVVDNTPFPPGTTRIFLSFTTPRFSHHPPPLGVAANQARLS